MSEPKKNMQSTSSNGNFAQRSSLYQEFLAERDEIPLVGEQRPQQHEAVLQVLVRPDQLQD